jgi:hypothetical protein
MKDQHSLDRSNKVKKVSQSRKRKDRNASSDHDLVVLGNLSGSCNVMRNESSNWKRKSDDRSPQHIAQRQDNKLSSKIRGSSYQEKSYTAALHAVRIAIGTKVHSTQCMFRYTRDANQTHGHIFLIYNNDAGKRVKHSINLEDTSLQEMRYFLANEDSGSARQPIKIDLDESKETSFLAMKIEPDDKNGLSQVHKRLPTIRPSLFSKQEVHCDRISLRL